MPVRIFCVLRAAAALALSQATTANGQTKAKFEVVSVKPVRQDRNERFESYCANGGRFIAHGTPLLWSIKWAYSLNDYQISPGWPAWLNSFGTYDIEAETDGPVTGKDCRRMVRALFEERFRLRMHPRSKTISVYALILAKSAP